MQGDLQEKLTAILHDISLQNLARFGSFKTCFVTINKKFVYIFKSTGKIEGAQFATTDY